MIAYSGRQNAFRAEAVLRALNGLLTGHGFAVLVVVIRLSFDRLPACVAVVLLSLILFVELKVRVLVVGHDRLAVGAVVLQHV